MKFIVDPDIDIDLYFAEYPEIDATKVEIFKSEYQILNVWELNSPASSLDEDVKDLIQNLSYKPLTFSISDIGLIQGQELESLLQIIKSTMKIKYHIIIPDLRYIPLDDTAFFVPFSNYYVNFDPKINFSEIIGYKLVSNEDVSFLNYYNENYDVIIWNNLSLTEITNPLYNQIMYDLSQISDMYIAPLKNKKALEEIRNHWLLNKNQLDLIENPNNSTITCLVKDNSLLYEESAKSLLSGLILDINNGNIPRMKISVNPIESQDIIGLHYSAIRAFIDISPNKYIKSLASTIEVLPDMTIICPMCSFQSYLNFKVKLSEYLAKSNILSIYGIDTMQELANYRYFYQTVATNLGLQRNGKIYLIIEGKYDLKYDTIVNISELSEEEILGFISSGNNSEFELKGLIDNINGDIIAPGSVLIDINEIDDNRKDVVINYGQVGDGYTMEFTIRENIGRDELMDIINNVIYTEDILTDWGKCMIIDSSANNKNKLPTGVSSFMFDQKKIKTILKDKLE